MAVTSTLNIDLKKGNKAKLKMMNLEPIIDLLTSSITLSLPIVYAVIGDIYSERAGVFNIGLEGLMLFGAFAGVAGAFITGNIWYGVLFSLLSGIAIGFLHAILCIYIKINQIISGLLINMLALGLTTFLNGLVFGITRLYEIIPPFNIIKVPLLADIPIIGPVFFQQIWIGYIAFAILLLSHFILFHTTWGLNIRAVGENPETADAMGLNVPFIRFICVVISGALSGVGGAYLSLGLAHTFVNNMTLGRGYVAVAAVIFGKWRPVTAFYAALLFAATDSLQLRAQSLGITLPSQLLSMLPYILTVLVLAGVVGKSKQPSSLGIPYSRENN